MPKPLRDEATAGQLAKFDQAFALLTERLDEIVASYVAVRDEDRASPEIDLAGLAAFIMRVTDHESCAEVLAVAVDRLVKREADCG